MSRPVGLLGLIVLVGAVAFPFSTVVASGSEPQSDHAPAEEATDRGDPGDSPSAHPPAPRLVDHPEITQVLDQLATAAGDRFSYLGFSGSGEHEKLHVGLVSPSASDQGRIRASVAEEFQHAIVVEHAPASIADLEALLDEVAGVASVLRTTYGPFNYGIGADASSGVVEMTVDPAVPDAARGALEALRRQHPDRLRIAYVKTAIELVGQ